MSQYLEKYKLNFGEAEDVMGICAYVRRDDDANHVTWEYLSYDISKGPRHNKNSWDRNVKKEYIDDFILKRYIENKTLVFIDKEILSQNRFDKIQS